MTRTHLVIVNTGRNLHSGLEYAFDTFPEDRIVAMYVDAAADDPSSIRSDRSSTPTADWMDDHRAHAGEAFDDARATAADRGVDLETVVAFGRLTGAIREYCTANDVDTVVVACDDRDAFSSYVVADDVTRVANTAPVPVVVV